MPVEDVVFGSAAVLLLEIGGLTPGSRHDQFDITGALGLVGTLHFPEPTSQGDLKVVPEPTTAALLLLAAAGAALRRRRR